MLVYKWVTLDSIIANDDNDDVIYIHIKKPTRDIAGYKEYDWTSDGGMFSLRDTLPNLPDEIRTQIINELREDEPTPIEETSIYRLLKIKSL